MKKRWASILLTLAMVVSLLPATAVPARAAGEQAVTTFADLKSAFDGASTNADSPTEITLGANIDTTEGLSVGSGKYVTLDLAGHTIKRTSGNGYVIGVLGNLTLNDSSGTNTGKITGGNNGVSGGVYVSGGYFTMNGGTITGNSASYGGGVYVRDSGTFEMTGGCITGNNTTEFDAGGVRVETGTFKLSGNPVISGNYKNGTLDEANDVYTKGSGADSNLYVTNSGTLQVIGELMDGASIYMGTGLGNVFTSSTDVSLNDASKFHSDKGGTYEITQDGDGQLLVVQFTSVSTWDELSTKLANGGRYRLTADVTYSSGNSDLRIPDGKTVILDLAGHKIDANQANKICIKVEGKLTLNDSSVEKSGQITGSKVTSTSSSVNGGGVVISKEAAIFTMNGGKITGNYVATNGGGVYVTEGTFNMNGGEISGNTAMKSGGGVGISSTATFNMNGGTIIGNQASEYGGGVFVQGTFTVSGSASVTGNTAPYGTIESNVHLHSVGNSIKYITVNGPLTGTGKIGVTVYNPPASSSSPVTLTNTESDKLAYNVADKFESDHEDFTIYKDAADSQLRFGKPMTWSDLKTALSNGGEITLLSNVTAKSTDAALEVPSGKTVTLDLAGFTIDRNLTGETNDGYVIKVNGTLILTDSSTDKTGTITGGYAINRGGGVLVDLGTFTLNSGTISGNRAKDGGGVYVTSNGTFTMTGGTISGNTSTTNGGGVYLSPRRTFTMTGGTISGNTASYGGGVYDDGTFNLSGSSTITGNNASTNGGGVYVNNNGTFTMSGGTITENRTTGTADHTGNGGGVNAYSGTFTMSGGEISNNTANRYGGGAEVKTFTMTGGTISNNTANENGGGVFVDTSGTLKLSGTPTISGNKKSGADNNVGLLAGTTITVTDTLSNSTPIGVTTEKEPTNPIKVTNNLGTYANTSQFASDNTDYDLYAPSTSSSTYVVYLYTKKTITWKSQDGSTELEKDSNLKAGTKPHYDGAEPTKAPDEQYTYTFAGWATSANQESGRSDSSYDGVTKDTTYYAAFSKTARSYTLTWDADGGETTTAGTAAGSVAYGTALTAPTVTKAGYTFNGWSPEVSTTMPAENKTYTAQWTPINYTITYELDGGTGNASKTYTIESTDTLPTPTKSAHTFNGWKVTTAGGSWTADTVLEAGAPLTGKYGDVTLTAQWVDNGTVTTPTFSPAGGSYPGTQSVTISCTTGGATIYYTTDGAEPTASSAQYTGAISISTDTTIKAYAVKDGMTDSTVATAAYTISSAPATYTVTFDSDGGSAVPAQTVAGGGTATKPTDPTRSGYTFRAWQLSGTDYDFTTPVTGGITLVADWTADPAPTSTPAPTPAPTPVTYDDDDDDYEPTYTITAPVSGDENTVNVTVSVTGTAATLRSADIGSALSGNDETGDVVIDVSALGQDITSITIPAKTVSDIAAAVADGENPTDSLTVKLTDGTVTFDAAAVATIAEQAGEKDLRLNLDSIRTTSLKTAQQTAIADMEVEAVYDAYMTANGKRITDFKGGSATVTVTYALKEGQVGRGVVVWYVADDGGKTTVPTVYKDKTVRFTIEHFSNYVVAYDADLAAACSRDETCPIAAFADADPTAWYHDGIHYVLENSVMAGYGNGLFGPGDATSRAMLAQILWNLEGKPVADYALDFEDISENAWYIPALRWAVNEKLMEGYGGAESGTFSPNDPVTREQVAVILYRYAEKKGIDVTVGEDTNILSYDDAFDVSEWAMSAMQWACGAGIIEGKEDGSWLAPQGATTRAELAIMLMRFCAEGVSE